MSSLSSSEGSTSPPEAPLFVPSRPTRRFFLAATPSLVDLILAPSAEASEVDPIGLISPPTLSDPADGFSMQAQPSDGFAVGSISDTSIVSGPVSSRFSSPGDSQEGSNEEPPLSTPSGGPVRGTRSHAFFSERLENNGSTTISPDAMTEAYEYVRSHRGRVVAASAFDPGPPQPSTILIFYRPMEGGPPRNRELDQNFFDLLVDMGVLSHQFVQAPRGPDGVAEPNSGQDVSGDGRNSRSSHASVQVDAEAATQARWRRLIQEGMIQLR